VTTKEKVEGMLSPYRVLDLSDEKGLLCGKLLGDLGADVIKVEKPGGDAAREIGPFYHDEIDREKSLFWFAFNTSKRGITLDIEKAEGREILKRLVKGVDFVIESFPPGYLDRLGLGYADLEKVNPGVIMVSITPFGQSGPYRDYKAPGIVAWAMGGQMYPVGKVGHPPVQISHHAQAYLHGSVEAAVGSMVALYHRRMTCEGQHVDLSIQSSLAQATYMLTSSWEMSQNIKKQEEQRDETTAVMKILMPTMLWPCKDGYVMWFFYTGEAARRRNPPLVEWMDSEGMATDGMKEFDWDNFSLQPTPETEELTPEERRELFRARLQILEEPTSKFFMSHTMAELMDGAVKHRVTLYPLNSTAAILESAQLAARGFWVEVEHPELGTTITYPGAFTRASETPPGISRRPPLIGEHNQEVYQQELGMTEGEIQSLEQAGVI